MSHLGERKGFSQEDAGLIDVVPYHTHRRSSSAFADGICPDVAKALSIREIAALEERNADLSSANGRLHDHALLTSTRANGRINYTQKIRKGQG